MSSFVQGPGEFYTNQNNPPSITIKGLSTDTKPSATIFAGYYFFETDTGNTYLAYNGIWNLIVKASSGGGSGGSGIGNKFTANGGGSTFTIAHGLGVVPAFADVGAGSADARGTFSWTADATNITVTYPVATPSGTNNIVLWWTAGTQTTASSVTGGNTVSGTSTQSGDAATKIFTIAHGLPSLPSGILVEADSIDALGDLTWTFDATNITITYQAAPPSGSSNLTWKWVASFNVSVSGFTTSSTDTLTNKTIDGTLNTLKDIGRAFNSIVFKDTVANKTYAVNGLTGAVISSGTAGSASDDTVIAAAIAATPAGGTLLIVPSTSAYIWGANVTEMTFSNDIKVFAYGATVQAGTSHTGSIWLSALTGVSMEIYGGTWDINKFYSTGIGAHAANQPKLVRVYDATVLNHNDYGIQSGGDNTAIHNTWLDVQNCTVDAGSSNGLDECIFGQSCKWVTVRNCHLYNWKVFYLTGENVHVENVFGSAANFTSLGQLMPINAANVGVYNLKLEDMGLTLRNSGSADMNTRYDNGIRAIVSGYTNKVVNSVSRYHALEVMSYNDTFIQQNVMINDVSVDYGPVVYCLPHSTSDINHATIDNLKVSNAYQGNFGVNNSMITLDRADCKNLVIENVFSNTAFGANDSPIILNANGTNVTVSLCDIKNILPSPATYIVKTQSDTSARTCNITFVRPLPPNIQAINVSSGTPLSIVKFYDLFLRDSSSHYGNVSLVQASGGNGILVGLVTSTNTGTGATQAENYVNGILTRKFTSGTASPGVSNMRASAQLVNRRGNCILLASYTLNNTANVRLFIGFSGQTTAVSASTPDPLATFNGVGVFYDANANSGHVGIISNNAGANSAFVDMSTAVTAADTNRHTFAIYANDSGSSFTVIYDGIPTTITSPIPTSTNGLGFQIILDNGADTSSKTMDLYYLEMISN